MRVLHLNAGNMYGGVETVLVTLARQRNLAPHMEPEFGLCFRGRLWDELSAATVPVHNLGPVRLSRPWTVWRARRQLARVLADRRPDTVVAHCCWPLPVFAPVVRRFGARLVYWAHDAGLTPAARAGRRGWLEWAAGFNPPDLTLAISEFTRPFASALFPGVPCERVPTPLDARQPADKVEARRSLRRELHTPESDVVVVQVSRLVPYKGHGLLLKALAGLREVPGWSAWFVGGPQSAVEERYLSELNATAGALGVSDRVRFVGARADVPRLLAAADIHCQPNTGPELFGVTFIEGLSAGLPVVSTAIGAAVEILGDGSGVLVRPDRADELSAALRELIQQPDLRRRYGAAGPSRAAELCAPNRQIPVVADLLAGRSGRPSFVAPSGETR